VTAGDRFVLEPLDTLFLRDGRPFDASDEGLSEAHSRFPPTPDTVSSAMRAAFAYGRGWPGKGSWAKTNADLPRVLGKYRNDIGELSFCEPTVLQHASAQRRRAERVFPAPMHLAWDDDGVFLLLAPGETLSTDGGGRTNQGVATRSMRLLRPPPGAARPQAHAEGLWITRAGLRQVLSGQPIRDHKLLFSATDSLTDLEGRFGHARDSDHRTVLPGHLYTSFRVRLRQHVALGVQVFGLPTGWDPSGMVRLGGEGRLAAIRRGAWDDLDTADELVPTAPARDGLFRFVVVLTGPARLPANGGDWQPPDGHLDGHDGSGARCRVGAVVAAAVGRPEMIGGWDGRLREPLPLVPCLPAGSVFFIESEEPPPMRFSLGDRCRFGYGGCLIGHWPTSIMESTP